MRPSLMPPRPSPEVSTQRILPARTALGEPLRGHLALVAGEAADGGDLGAVDDLRARARLGGDGDRAAAVRARVGERLAQRGVSPPNMPPHARACAA